MPPPNTSYKTFILFGQRFTIGDVVMVNNGQNQDDFVGIIEKVRTDDKGEVQLTMRWYYRPEETAFGRQPYHGFDELLESDHTDTVHVHSVNCKCEVHTLSAYESLGTERKTTDDGVPIPEFFCRSFYLKDKGKLRAELPRYCSCNKPSNPDKVLLCCDQCDRWFHGECVNVTREQANRKKRWDCPSCEKGGKGARAAQPGAKSNKKAKTA